MLRFKVWSVVVCCLVFSLLVSMFGSFVPIGFASDSDSDSKVDEAYWLRLANKAWDYFKPGVGVNANTGLHSAGIGYNYFTFWDLAVYINAILDAQELGIISAKGNWGADYRFEKVLSWLESAELASSGLPYLWYETNTGRPAFSLSREDNNAYDYGHFLVAMARAVDAMPHFADRIYNVVVDRFNTESLVSGVRGNRDYTYFVAHGFAFFGFNSTRLTEELNLLSIWDNGSKVSMYGVSLPKTRLICEPLLLAMFAFGEDEPLLSELMYDVYLVHEARYNETGKFVATSEGNTDRLSDPTYVYEHVVGVNGEPWIMYPNSYSTTPVSITPIAYFKVAVSFLALYDTSYAKEMVDYLEPKLATPDGLFSAARGYKDGIDENNRVIGTVVDKTNGLILSAANYAITNIVTQTPTPTPSPTPTPLATDQPTPSPTTTPDSPAVTPPPETSTPSSISDSPTPTPTAPVSPSPTTSLEPDLSPSATASVSASPSSFPTPAHSPSLSPESTLSIEASTNWLSQSLSKIVLLIALCILIILILAIAIKRSK